MITRYSELKAKGMVSIEKRNEKYYIIYRKFDKYTGEEKNSVYEQITKEDVVRTRQSIQSMRDSLVELVADVNALDNI